MIKPIFRTVRQSVPHPVRISRFSTTPQRALQAPINIPKWLEKNSHLLQPPVNNYCVTNEHMTVMIVGGPNARTDYHINTTPEYFYQYKGSMLLKTIQQSTPTDPTTTTSSPQNAVKFVDIPINEGDMYLLPPNTPHNPVRFANTVGIVIEQPRPEGSVDKLRWYCQGCGDVVHEKEFFCRDLGSQIKDAVEAFGRDREARTCRGCGVICDVRPKES